MNMHTARFIIPMIAGIAFIGISVLFFAAVSAAPAHAAEWRTKADDDWKAIDSDDLSILPGTALDFSFLVEPGEAGQHGFCIINKQGQFAFAQRPDIPVRFFCAPQLPGARSNIAFGDVEALAEQIKRAGYNTVRAHFLDQDLMWNSKTECVFNPEMVDRFDRYTAALKKRGIYLCMDASSSWAAFSIYKSWDKESQAQKMKQRFYYDDAARDLWKRGVRQIFEHVNPYTGRALKDEPQVVWVALRNEPGLNFLNPASDPGLVVPFRAWLKKRYATAEAWTSAWGSERVGAFTMDTVDMPTLKEKGPAANDLQRFITDIEQEAYFWGAAYLRSIGIKVPVIDYNNGGSMQSIIARDVLPFVDNHVYHDHPNGAWLAAGMKMECSSSLARQIGDFRWIIGTRILGRPFTMTEWGGVFWNPYRHHDGITFAAYAAFQDWQLIAQHATPVYPSLGIPGDPWAFIVPFMVAKDPAAKANERMTAFLFGRGDVSASPHRIALRFDARTSFDSLAMKDAVSYALTPLSLLAGFGAMITGGNNSALNAPYTPDLIVDPVGGAEIKTIAGAELASSEGAGAGTEGLVERLRQKNILGAQNRTDIGQGIFESDTRELYLASKSGRFTVNTPRSQGVCLPDGPAQGSAGDIEVENNDACMTLLLSSLSEQPINKSKRLLLILSGNALNSDMVFTDETMKTMQKIGNGPVLLRVLDVRITARLAASDAWEVWALAQNGTRMEKIPAATASGALSMRIRTGELKNGPTPYFEIVRAGK